jgi:uncharacterized protein (DUF1501 family)
MNRRDFIKLTMYSTVLAGMSSSDNSALASHGGLHKRTLINVMCLGGADFRYLFTPSPMSTSYATPFWESRKALYNTTGDDYATYQDAFTDRYLSTQGGPDNGFGIHKNAGWLKTQFDSNNVAIICNVIGSSNRRHDQSQLIVNTGDLNASKFVLERDGWGGRLAESIGAANVVSMTNDISIFAKGTDENNRNAKVIHARNSRDFALSKGIVDEPTNNKTKQARALKNYYLSKRQEIKSEPAGWPFRKFVQHENAIRDFGDPFKILTDANPLPTGLTDVTLTQGNFKTQCQNIYDSFTGADLFKLRVASVEYTGWDSHKNQKAQVENSFEDLFGTGKGLDTLTSSLDVGANDNTVFVFTSDFGRQLCANGTAGTDHGKGSYTILIGPSVNGGVYGDMFPDSEIAQFDTQGADITGLTSFERVLAAACDWVEPGSGKDVFPNTKFNDLSIYPDGPILEMGVDLSTLFS